MLKVNFTNPAENEYEIEGKLWQYDWNQDIVITGLDLPIVLEVDFSTVEREGSAIPCDGFTTEDSITTARIPNSILADDSFTQDYKLYIFIYVTDENSGKTLHKIKTKVYARPKADGQDIPVDRPPFEQAVEEVKKYSDAAYNSKIEAQLNASLAVSSRRAAEESAYYAQWSEESARASSNNANIYKSQASAAQTKAETAAKTAEVNMENSYTYANNAQKSSESAEQHEIQAGNYANIAKTSETNSAKSEQEAKNYAQNALYSKNDAQQARNEAVEAYEKIKDLSTNKWYWCSEEEVGEDGKPNINEPDLNTLYFVPNKNTSGNNLFDEYAWKGYWEQIGTQVSIDLKQYAKKTDLPKNLSDLTEDATHRVVTDTEKNTWNAKSDFSGSYNDLTDKPDIPDGSQLANLTYDEENKQIISISAETSFATQDELNEVTEDIQKLYQLIPETEPTVGKVLKVLAVNKNGTFVCEWADAPSGGGIIDVQLPSGISIVDENGVGKLPYSTTNSPGITYPWGMNYGLQLYGTSGGMVIAKANKDHIDGRRNDYAPIVSTNLDYSVKAAMCDGKGAAWTPEEQVAAQERIGIKSVEEVLF